MEKKIVEISYGETMLHTLDYTKKNITDLILPDTLIEIGDDAFRGNFLSKVVIPNNVITIGNSAFEENNLKEVVIGQKVKTIGTWAFTRNEVEEVIIPNSVTRVGYFIFSRNKIKKIIIGRGLNEISRGMFSDNLLTSVVVPDNIIKIGTNAFASNLIKHLILGNGVAEIGDGAFIGNELTNLVIPRNVRKIGENAFGGNKSLKEITLYSSNIELGRHNFYYVENINIVENNDFSFKHFFSNKFLSNFPNLKNIRIVLSKSNNVKKTFLEFKLKVFKSKLNSNIEISIIDISTDDLKKINVCEQLKSDKEIYELIEKINKIVVTLPNQSMIDIKTKTEKHLIDYLNFIESIKPTLDLENRNSVNLTINGDPKTKKIELIIYLEKILLSLSNHEKNLKDLKKVKIYQQVLCNEEFDRNIQEDVTCNQIKELILVSEELELPNIVEKMQEMAIKTEINILKNIYTDFNLELKLSPKNVDFLEKFENEVQEMHNKYLNIKEKLKPYLRFKEALEFNDSSLEISKELKEVEYIILQFDKENQKKFNDEILNIKNEISIILKENIEKIIDGGNAKYKSKEIELIFRNKFLKFIESLQKNVINLVGNKKILEELAYCKKNCDASNFSETCNCSGAITSLINDIRNSLINITNEDKNKIYEKIKKYFQNGVMLFRKIIIKNILQSIKILIQT